MHIDTTYPVKGDDEIIQCEPVAKGIKNSILIFFVPIRQY